MKTISSRKMALLAGKKHKTVVRHIMELIPDPAPDFYWDEDKAVHKVEYNVPETVAMSVMLGYAAEYKYTGVSMALIKIWKELMGIDQ